MEIDNAKNTVASVNTDVIAQQSDDEDDDVLTELVSVPKAYESEKDGNDGGTLLFLSI